MTTVTVYSKPVCVQCNATYRILEAKGIAYETVDLSRDAQALKRVRALGYLQARHDDRGGALVRVSPGQD